jgi:hypothetical protein
VSCYRGDFHHVELQLKQAGRGFVPKVVKSVGVVFDSREDHQYDQQLRPVNMILGFVAFGPDPLSVRAERWSSR